MKKEEWQNKGQGHRSRLRDRFLDRGIDGLSDAEIIELLLSFGTPRTDCKEPARAALQTFGTLAAVLEAPRERLLDIQGIGKKNCFALGFIQAVSRRYLQQRLVGKEYLTSSEDVRSYLLHSMRDLKKEILTVIFLDGAHAIIATEVLAQGTVNVNTVYPREIVGRALELSATALIIAHNHPSGQLEPSAQDMQLTRALYLLCQMMNLTLLDHFIIGRDTLSFADKGLMRSVGQETGRVLRQLEGKG